MDCHTKRLLTAQSDRRYVLNGCQRALPTLLLSLAACLLTGCATIISGTTAKININGDVGEPVNISTTYADYRDVSLPVTVKVKRRSLDGQHIRISSANHAFSDIVLRSSVNPWCAASVFAYILPFFADLATNAVSEPAQSSFFITPAAPLAKADSVHRADSLRLAASAAAAKQPQQLPQRFNRHELRGGLGFGHCQATHDRDRLVDRYLQQYKLTTSGDCFDLVGNAFLQAGLEYHYRLNRKWDVGVLANWGIAREGYDSQYYVPEYADPRYYQPDFNGIGHEFSRFFVVAPSVRYTWCEGFGWRCYSRLALGALRQHLRFEYNEYPWQYNEYPQADTNQTSTETTDPEPTLTDISEKTKWRMAYQLTAIGGSIGSDVFSLWGELGYGSLGIVRLGVAFMF